MQFKVISTAAAEPLSELVLTITKSKTAISNLRGRIQQLHTAGGPANQAKVLKITPDLDSAKVAYEASAETLITALKTWVDTKDDLTIKIVLLNCLTKWGDWLCDGNFQDSSMRAQIDNFSAKIHHHILTLLPVSAGVPYGLPHLLDDSFMPRIHHMLGTTRVEEFRGIFRQVPNALRTPLDCKCDPTDIEIDSFFKNTLIALELLHVADTVQNVLVQQLANFDGGAFNVGNTAAKIETFCTTLPLLTGERNVLQWGGTGSFRFIHSVKGLLVRSVEALSSEPSGLSAICVDNLAMSFEGLLREFCISQGIDVKAAAKDFLDRDVFYYSEINALLDRPEVKALFSPTDFELLSNMLTQNLNLRNRAGHSEILLQEYLHHGNRYLALLVLALVRLANREYGTGRPDLSAEPLFESVPQQASVTVEFLQTITTRATDLVTRYDGVTLLQQVATNELMLPDIVEVNPSMARQAYLRVLGLPIVVSQDGMRGHASRHYGTTAPGATGTAASLVAAESGEYGRLNATRTQCEFTTGPYLGAVFLEGVRAGKITADAVMDFLKTCWQVSDMHLSPALELIDAPLRECIYQITRFSTGEPVDFGVGIKSLSLKIEALLKEANKSLRRMPTITQILDSQAIKSVFSPSEVLFFKTILSEAWGYSIRHESAHGFNPAKNYVGEHGLRITVLLLTTLLHLAHRGSRFDSANAVAALLDFQTPASAQLDDIKKQEASSFIKETMKTIKAREEAPNVCCFCLATSPTDAVFFLSQTGTERIVATNREGFFDAIKRIFPEAAQMTDRSRTTLIAAAQAAFVEAQLQMQVLRF